MWICDGRRLHRYDPIMLQPVATIDLDVDCEEVYATTTSSSPTWTNEDVDQSGTAAAAFVDPASNQILATVSLPVDVAYPAVLDDAVFFPGRRRRRSRRRRPQHMDRQRHAPPRPLDPCRTDGDGRCGSTCRPPATGT